MKLRNKPKKPSKKKIKLSYPIYAVTLQDIVDYFRNLLKNDYTEDEIDSYLKLKNIKIDSEWDYDEYGPIAVIEIPPPPRKYDAELKDYEKRLAAYNQWCDENKDAIKAEKERREREAAEKELERERAIAERTRIRLNKLEKKLFG